MEFVLLDLTMAKRKKDKGTRNDLQNIHKSQDQRKNAQITHNWMYLQIGHFPFNVCRW
jgi:hypothetical protein